jgi:hypothetical protein
VVRQPEGTIETPRQFHRLALQPVSCLDVVEIAQQRRHAIFRVVHVSLHLAWCDRRFGGRAIAVVEATIAQLNTL